MSTQRIETARHLGKQRQRLSPNSVFVACTPAYARAEDPDLSDNPLGALLAARARGTVALVQPLAAEARSNRH
jgi:hypothetical protein